MPAPTTPSLAYKVETWAIDVLSEHATLTGVPILHQEEDADAPHNRIVCAAKLGDKSSDGAKPWEVNLSIRIFLSGKNNAGTLEDYATAIDETFEEPPTVASLAAFSYLTILDSEEEEKDVRRDSRQREKTFTIHALES